MSHDYLDFNNKMMINQKSCSKLIPNNLVTQLKVIKHSLEVNKIVFSKQFNLLVHSQDYRLPGLHHFQVII